MSKTASLSSEELSLSVFLLFCSVLLKITSRDKSVFSLFLFTDKVSGEGGCIQFPGRKRRVHVCLHCQDIQETGGQQK